MANGLNGKDRRKSQETDRQKLLQSSHTEALKLEGRACKISGGSLQQIMMMLMLKLVVWGEKLKADFVVNWYFNCLNGIQCTSVLPVKHKRLHPNTVPWKSSHRTACHHRLPHIMLITHQCSENKNTQCDVQQNFILPNMLSSKIARQKRKKTHTHTK